VKKYLLVLFSVLLLFGCNKKEETNLSDYQREYENNLEIAKEKRYKEYFTIDRYYQQWGNMTTEDIETIPKQENDKIIGLYIKVLDVKNINNRRVIETNGSAYGNLNIYDDKKLLSDIKREDSVDLHGKIVNMRHNNDKNNIWSTTTNLSADLIIVSVDEVYRLSKLYTGEEHRDKPIGEDY